MNFDDLYTGISGLVNEAKPYVEIPVLPRDLHQLHQVLLILYNQIPIDSQAPSQKYGPLIKIPISSNKIRAQIKDIIDVLDILIRNR